VSTTVLIEPLRQARKTPVTVRKNHCAMAVAGVNNHRKSSIVSPHWAICSYGKQVVSSVFTYGFFLHLRRQAAKPFTR
jgi:hypothetical protein